jgi:hypothetical protein
MRYAGHLVFSGQRIRGNRYFGNVFKIEEIKTYRILIYKPLEKRTLGKVKKILNIT